jgi:hypothetical protein
MNTITANVKTHLYIVAAEWKEASSGKKKLEFTLSIMLK